MYREGGYKEKMRKCRAKISLHFLSIFSQSGCQAGTICAALQKALTLHFSLSLVTTKTYRWHTGGEIGSTWWWGWGRKVEDEHCNVLREGSRYKFAKKRIHFSLNLVTSKQVAQRRRNWLDMMTRRMRSGCWKTTSLLRGKQVWTCKKRKLWHNILIKII